MPRRGNVPKRDVLPDPVYGSKVVAKLINQIMLDGNKATAQKIVYDAFDMMKEKLNQDPLEIFNQAMANVMPVLEVKARRVGGANYHVQQHGRLGQEERRYPPHGGGEQGFRAFPLVKGVDYAQTIRS